MRKPRAPPQSRDARVSPRAQKAEAQSLGHGGTGEPGGVGVLGSNDRNVQTALTGARCCRHAENR